MITDLVLTNIRETILKNIPPDVGKVKIEFEGPKIAIILDNPRALIENENIIKKVAKTIKKRIIIKVDPESRLPEEKAREVILSVVPSEAEVKHIYFDDNTGEVEIEARKPGYVIGKEGRNLRQIILLTGWRPKVIRTPPVESKTIAEVRSILRLRSAERQKFMRDLGTKIHRSPFFKTSRVRIVALGGFQEVGRSAILVQTDESNILLDCGIKPSLSGDEYPYIYMPEFDIDQLDAVIVTHAHLDHCGLIPYLFKYGYKGPIYCTAPTRDLMKLLQEDYIQVSIKEGRTPLYSKKDIYDAIAHTVTLEYGEVTDIAPDVKLTLHDAGHILGSALAHLHIGNGLCNIVYTGDFKFERTALLEAAGYRFPRLEVLIMESTYGGREDYMRSREETEREFLRILNQTLLRKGKVLIPVLAVGRAQEIMLVISNAINKNILPEVPVYIEGMMNEVTAIHLAYPEFLSREMREKIYKDEIPLLSEYFVAVDDPQKRLEVAEGDPCIILATSGMLMGGPVLEYLRLLADDPRNSLVFVSYQIEGTLGRRILDGQREIEFVDQTGKIKLIRLQLEVYRVEGFSGHSDRRQLIRYVSRVTPRPEKIILCHGEKSKSLGLAIYIQNRFKIPAVAPNNLESIRVR